MEPPRRRPKCRLTPGPEPWKRWNTKERRRSCSGPRGGPAHRRRSSPIFRKFNTWLSQSSKWLSCARCCAPAQGAWLCSDDRHRAVKRPEIAPSPSGPLTPARSLPASCSAHRIRNSLFEVSARYSFLVPIPLGKIADLTICSRMTIRGRPQFPSFITGGSKHPMTPMFGRC